MKVPFSKLLTIACLLTTLFPLAAACQDLTGIWRGWFTTDDGEQYKCEIQIAQNKSKSIGGVSYSYLDTRFYGKASLSGLFNKASKSAIIQEIKTVDVKMSEGSVACIMKYMMNYSKSGQEEFLEGNFTSKYEKADLLHHKGDPAGGGTVFLRKVITSDFYIEPFLRNKVAVKKDDPSLNKVTVQTKPQSKPKSKPPVTNKTAVTKPPVTKKQVTVKTNLPQVKTQPTTLPKDTVKRTTSIAVEKPKEITPVNIPATTRSRENHLVRTLIVNHENISVRLYDNGEVDGDTISVYLDGKPIVSSKGLSTIPITVNLKLDDSNPDHVLVMVAENMGRIPPNTSLMIVQDGDKRYEVSITSTEQKNAMVRFRYQKE
ncbi:MAG: hypothetical protein ACXVLT_14440 [Flavisolibacter sp.]